MKKKTRLSLQIRVLLLTILVATLLLVGIEKLTSWRTVTALENEIGGQVNNAAKQLVINLKQYPLNQIPFKFKILIQPILKQVPSILRIDVYAKNKKTLELIASTLVKERILEDFEREALQSGKAKTYMIETEPGRRRIITVRPIRFQEGQTGIVTVICSLKSFRQLLTIHSRVRNTSLAITIVLLIVIITWLFQSGIYRNIHYLVNTMSRFRQGEQHARVRPDLPGEFGDLALQLNVLLEEVSQFQVKLESDVAAATHSLSQRNIELNQLNVKMHEMQKQLTHAERLAVIGQLTATFAHEIGSPLSAVATHLQMLEEEVLDSALRLRVKNSYDQIIRICGIVEKLLARTRQGGEKQSVHLQEVIGNVIRLITPLLEMKNIELDVRLDTAPAEMMGETELLQQLFLNLFNNAIDALGVQGKISISLIRKMTDPVGYQILFADNGVGIPSEKITDIFQPFFTTKEIGKGTGLGLAVCQEIVKRHAGTIEVKSQPGLTQFVIFFPLEEL